MSVDTDQPMDPLESYLDAEISSLFVAFRDYRLRAPRTMENRLSDRAIFLHDHGTSLECLGFNLPGLAVLEAMLTPKSPVTGFDLVEQVKLVDRGIEAAYVQSGRDDVPRGYFAHTYWREHPTLS